MNNAAIGQLFLIKKISGNFRKFLPEFNGRADVIVCMGDTVTHLENIADITQKLRINQQQIESILVAKWVQQCFRKYFKQDDLSGSRKEIAT